MWPLRKCSRRMMDPGILFLEEQDELLPDLSNCLERAGMDNLVTHNALDDAKQVRDLIEFWWRNR